MSFKLLNPLFFLLLVGFFFACTKDSNPTANDLYDHTVELLKTGQIPEAREESEKALQLAEIEYGPENPALIKFIQQLAYIYQGKGEFEQAKSLYDKALGIIKKAYGANSFEEAQLLNNLAIIYISEQEYDKAISVYDQSLAIASLQLSENDPRVDKIRENIANCKQLKNSEPKQIKKKQVVTDLVPEEIKKAAIDRLAGQNIFVSNLSPIAPVKIGENGIVLPYRCMKQMDENTANGIEVVMLFAASQNPDKENAYVFKQCRLVSYESYQAEQQKENKEELKQVLANIFPDLLM